MTDFTQYGWRTFTSGLPAEKRKQAFKDLASGKHKVTGDEGKPLEFSGGPTALLKSSQAGPYAADAAQETSSPEPDATPVTKSFSLGDRAAFEDCIANETPLKKVEMRLWFDRMRRENGLDKANT